MTEECIICGKPGGFYITCGSTKAGPFCSQHRYNLGAYCITKKNEMVDKLGGKWIDEYLKAKMKKKAD